MAEETAEIPQGDNHSDHIGRKPTKVKVLKDLKEDMRSADTLRLEMVGKIECWRKEYRGDPYGNEQKGKSEIVSRDIKRQDEWQHASIKDPFVADPDIVKAGPVTAEDRPLAEQNETVLNNQFCRHFPRYKFMTDVIKLHYSEGTVVAKTSWDYEDEIIKEEVPIFGMDFEGNVSQVGTKEVKRLKVKVNKPHAQVCRIEDIYMDPTSEGDMDKAQFVIHRYESDLSTLRKTKKYKNLKKLAAKIGDRQGYDNSDYEEEDETEFKFVDKPRKKFLVHEYWGNYDVDGDGIAEPIVCTWVEDIMLQLQSNPYPDKKIPFLVLANNSTPFKIYGEGNAELIGDNQKMNTAIKRGIIDNMANSNNAQKGMRVGSLDAINKKRFLNGKNFEYNGSQGDFYEGGYNAIPNSVFSVMEQNNNETESMLGVKAFSGGIQGSQLGSTARAAGGVLDAVSVRRVDIVRNIAENLIKPLMRKWMAYNAEFLSEEEVVRITNKQYIPHHPDDLDGSVDIEIQVSTAEDNEAKAQKLSFLLQTLGPEMDQGMRNIVMSRIAKLQRMPDLAEQMATYKPEPDPFVEKMKMLEMKKLMSEITERESRTAENQASLAQIEASTTLDLARARELGSNADLKDQDFVRKADGKEFNEEMQKEAFKHGSTMQVENLKGQQKASSAQ
jgi:hypothetical protein